MNETQTRAGAMEHEFQGVDSECRRGGEDVFDPGLLADWLARSGYGEFVANFDPLMPRPHAWRACRESVPVSLKPVVDLFLMNESVDADAIPASLQALIPALLDIGLIVALAGNRIATPGLVILPVWGNWLICERPGPNPAFYFGEDSVALLARMLPRSGGDCLDLCTGPGLHAVHCARFARSVAAVEIDATAARLARINARLNRVADRLDVFHGDLYQPVEGRRFHTIVANPPLLPYPDTLPAPRVGYAGPDGFRIVGRILEGLPRALRDGGVAQIIGMTLSDGRMPVIAGRLDSIAKESDMAIRFSALSHKRLMSGDAYFDLVTGSIMRASGKGDSLVKDALRKMLASQKCSHLCTFFLHVVPGNGQFDLVDVSQPDRPGFWYI
ncbi:methyltransferase [Burkholderia ubonensis]|uniref:methyltransferase n=1 Tax=Burkholderia ubonensis TaxID=101571 RepID=UPI0011607835|nr:methyltransferase [Burkholderia ubonensis]